MEKYITCIKQTDKSYFQQSSSVNKISYSYEREEKPCDDKNNFDFSKDNFFNKIDNNEDFLYYQFCRNLDPMIMGNENETRKESEVFKSTTNLNLKLENSILNSYDHSHFFIKKDCETGIQSIDYLELNFNFQNSSLKNDINLPFIEPSTNSNIPIIDDKFSEAEVKICKEFYDTIKLKYEIFKQKNLLKSSPDLSNKSNVPKFIPASVKSTDSFSSRKRNKYLMCSEDLKKLCISKVKVKSIK